MNEWMQLLQTFGVAVVCLFALGVAVWRGANWVATHIVTPMVDRHLRLLDALIASVLAQGEVSAQQVETLKKIGHSVSEIRTLQVRSDQVQITPSGR